jgi:deoxyribonuclease IV
MQIFLSAPQRWQAPKHSDEQVDAFCSAIAAAGIAPTFAHGTYLLNLAAVDPGIHDRTVENLTVSAGWCDRIGLAGIVVHVGSGHHQTLEEAENQVTLALERVLAAGGECAIVLENSAGSGETLGSRFEQIGALFARLGRDKRLGLCVDTAHTFASGYDLRSADGLEQAVAEIDRHVGLNRLLIIHANDSKVGLNSFVDRHENIGRGQIGAEAFERMLAHPALRDKPWVLEVPGYEDTGPDLPNVLELKRLAGREVGDFVLTTPAVAPKPARRKAKAAAPAKTPGRKSKPTAAAKTPGRKAKPAAAAKTAGPRLEAAKPAKAPGRKAKAATPFETPGSKAKPATTARTPRRTRPA